MPETAIHTLQPYCFADWMFTHEHSELRFMPTNKITRLEPKVSDLLRLLLDANGSVLSRDQLVAVLWPDVVVSEDTLARTVSRLRAVLSDSASNPQYIQTIPKKGYRFLIPVETKSQPKAQKSWFIGMAAIAPIICALLASVIWDGYQRKTKETFDETLSRADSLYMQFDEQSNEAAIVLYEKVLEQDVGNARAQAGVANAMVQRVVRWPSAPYTVEASRVSLTSALASGQLQTPDARLMLERARLIAEKAVRMAPTDVQALKSLGFVYSAEAKFERAIKLYLKAIKIDGHAWRSLINLAELYALNGEQQKSLDTFIRAFDAMQARFAEEPQNIGPWQPSLGNIIAKRYAQNGDEESAQKWARRVLDVVPFEREASTTLIESLIRDGREDEARRVCEAYASKLSPLIVCNKQDSV